MIAVWALNENDFEGKGNWVECPEAYPLYNTPRPIQYACSIEEDAGQTLDIMQPRQVNS